jgi:CAAX prenyl protease-like protein
MRWEFSWEAVGVGIGVFVIWVGLEGFYPTLGSATDVPWNPHHHFGEGSALAWLMISTRILGSTLVVPPLEEVFYRSFMYRYLVKLNFLEMPLNRWHPLSFFVTCLIFGLMHPQQWLAGILCGLAFQYLVLRKNRLGDAMTAHAITNFLLGLWVVWRGDWKFW